MLMIQQWAAIQSNPLLSKTGYFFHEKNSFQEATKWHCCPVTAALRESYRMAPTELQARLLLELLQESSWTKRIPLAVARPLQGQTHLQWFARLLWWMVSPISFFRSFCLIFGSGSLIASTLTFRQHTPSWGQKGCGVFNFSWGRILMPEFLRFISNPWLSPLPLRPREQAAPFIS